MWHGMKILRSEGHQVYTMHMNKVLLSAFDNKRWIADDVRIWIHRAGDG